MEVGDVVVTNKSGKALILDFINGRALLLFLSTGFLTSVERFRLNDGRIKDRMKPSVFGVGYLGVGKYKTKNKGVNSKSYKVWKGMIQRCYSSIHQKRFPSYIGCKVCDDWKNYQIFSEWFHRNYKENTEIDKDILIDGNKVYSPETCKFVTKSENVKHSSSKHYELIDPSGELVSVKNLYDYSRNNGLDRRKMYALANGKINKYKGYKINSAID